MGGKPDKPLLSEDERLLFREAMQGVRPLNYEGIAPQTKPVKAAVRQQTETTGLEPAVNALQDPHFPEDLPADEVLFFCRPGLQQRTLRKLRRGRFGSVATLDLHSHSVAQARQAVQDFLDNARAQRWQFVTIVHGKGSRSANGQAVLKKMVNFWLPQFDAVLAFCSARPWGGGLGAVNVLLKITD